MQAKVAFTLLSLTFLPAGCAAPDELDELDELSDESEEDRVSAGRVIVNEIMYAPSGAPEWVEFHNPGDAAISLDGWLLTDNEGVDINEGEYWFPAGTTLASGGYLVVGTVAGGSIQLSWSTRGPALANTGDDVWLTYDADHNGLFSSTEVIDGLTYTNSWGGAGGTSLARTCIQCTTNSASSWASSPMVGGTPGAANTNPPTPTPTPTPPNLPGSGKRVLFDAAHCQTCGDADWIITGGYSSFADALRAQGFEVGSLTTTFTLDKLTPWDVLVIPEPNKNFGTTERTALLQYTQSGGGILMIADHAGADRNNDGWDAVEIFNGYKSGTRTTSNDWLANNYRFRFKESQYSQDPITDIRSSPVTTSVDAVGMYSGTTLEILDTSRVSGVIYMKDTNRGPYVTTTSPSSGGRIVAIGDSSPFDDGTCSCSDTLHDNWYDYDHQLLGVNMVVWLSGI